MSTIIKNKWDINYIQTLPAQIQKKLLQQMLEKVFITKKNTQCKMSHTLKTDVLTDAFLAEKKTCERACYKLFKFYYYCASICNFAIKTTKIMVAIVCHADAIILGDNATSRIQSADQNERLNIDKRLKGLYGNTDVLISVNSLSPEKVNDTSNLGSVSTNWDSRNIKIMTKTLLIQD